MPRTAFLALLALALCLVALPVTAAPAPLPKPPKNKVKIVGVWEPVHVGGRRRGRRVLFEFTRGGELRLRAAEGPPPRTPARGTISYTVDGDKLMMTIKKAPGGMELRRTHTITRLTDTELHYRTETGKVVEFKRTRK